MKVMRFQTLKNRPNFACEHGEFSQRQSHIGSFNLLVYLHPSGYACCSFDCGFNVS